MIFHNYYLSKVVLISFSFVRERKKRESNFSLSPDFLSLLIHLVSVYLAR